MKIKVEIDESLQEAEVVIRCSAITDEIQQLQNVISNENLSGQRFVLYKNDTEYYVALQDILFFETEGAIINVHTRDQVYETKYRLYELEEILPGYFLRVSKSTIANTKEIYSLSKSNLSTTSVAEFSNSHKQVFVSRHYSKLLKECLAKKRQ